jgi:heme/copper-type cytochrome/quinol oxidase subunit 1
MVTSVLLAGLSAWAVQLLNRANKAQLVRLNAVNFFMILTFSRVVVWV